MIIMICPFAACHGSAPLTMTGGGVDGSAPLTMTEGIVDGSPFGFSVVDDYYDLLVRCMSWFGSAHHDRGGGWFVLWLQCDR